MGRNYYILGLLIDFSSLGIGGSAHSLQLGYMNGTFPNGQQRHETKIVIMFGEFVIK